MPQSPSTARRPRTSKATRILLMMTILGAVVFIALVVGAIWAFSRLEQAKVAEGSFLRIELSGAVQDAPMQGALILDPNEIPPSPADMARAIRRAATDDRIRGVYLKLDSPSLGWGIAQELRSALVDFRSSGKPCVAYSSDYHTGGYYLASACDRVVVAPGGLTLVSGLSTTIAYYAGMFEWMGIQAQFEHVGDFKSAVEPYERTGPSDGAIEAYNTVLDSIYGRMIADVAKSRGKTEDEIRALVDRAPMSPEDAVAEGLVDAAAYPDAVKANLKDALAADWVATVQKGEATEDDEDEKDAFTDVSEYVRDSARTESSKASQIAVVYAEGPIVEGDADGGLFAEQVLADGPFREWMQAARDDDAVKAVVLRVNSPGGSGLASDLMWREIELTQAAGKPVVASMANYAASGGYLIACSTNWIVAEPSTITGSIGVFGGKLVVGGTLDKIGVTTYQFKRGELSDLLSATQPFSDAGRAAFRNFLDDFYSVFLKRVAEGRNRTTDEVHAVAQGRIWTGEQALERGLVDEIGGLDRALVKAAELAGVTDYGIRTLPEPKSFIDLLLEDLQKTSAPTIEIAPIPGAEEALREVVLLGRMLEGNGIAAYLPPFE